MLTNEQLTVARNELAREINSTAETFADLDDFDREELERKMVVSRDTLADFEANVADWAARNPTAIDGGTVREYTMIQRRKGEERTTGIAIDFGDVRVFMVQ